MKPVPLALTLKMPKNQNFENLSPMPVRHYKPFMLDGGSMKSEGKGILLCENQ